MSSDRLRASPLPWLLGAFLTLVFLGKIAFLLATPLRALVMSPWLIDDSFITMRVARNIALGHGFSFDGLHPTTGVSMLWSYVIAIPQALLSKESAVRATLVLSTFFGLASSFLLYIIGTHITDDRRVAAGAAVLTALLPVQFFNGMNGMETAFFTFVIVLGLGGTAGAIRFSTHPVRHGLWTGLALGIALLTRADALFAIASAVLWKGWEWWTLRDNRRAKGLELLGLIGMVALCFAVILAWQAVQTGSPFPDNQVGRRMIAIEKQGLDPLHLALLPFLKVSAWNIFELDALWSLAVGSSLLGLLALINACVRPCSQKIGCVTATYITLFAAALCFYQWYFPDFHGLRYLNAGSYLVILCVAMFVAGALGGYLRGWLVATFLVVLLGLSWYRFIDNVRGHASFRQMALFGQRDETIQAQFWAAIDWVKESIPEGTVIGLRDHGRMAFFTDRPIQDLASILDGNVFSHRADGTLGAYLVSRGVSYVFLPPPDPTQQTIYQDLHEALVLNHVPGAPAQDITGYEAYRVRGVRP